MFHWENRDKHKGISASCRHPRSTCHWIHMRGSSDRLSNERLSLSWQRMHGPVSFEGQLYPHAWILSLLPSQGFCSCSYVLFLQYHFLFLYTIIPTSIQRYSKISLDKITYSRPDVTSPFRYFLFSSKEGCYSFLGSFTQAFISSIPLKSFLVRLRTVLSYQILWAILNFGLTWSVS